MPLSQGEIERAVADFQWPQEEEDEANKIHQEFLKRYPRERIPSLTLEEYALGIGNGTKKGACYWIEYETDKLGSARGGAAFKHIVFFDPKLNRWRYRSRFPSETAAFQAVKDGLLKMFKLAEADRFSEIDAVEPFDTQNLTRGKWLYLYFPEKFLPISSIENLSDFCQMFGLKLPEPPSATLLNRTLLDYKNSNPVFSGWSNLRFMRFLYAKFPPVAYWKIAPGKEASEWEDCRAKGYICIGWDEVGDLNQYEDQQALRKPMLDAYPKENKRQASQVWRFRNLEVGDIILANRGMTSIVGVGRITGPYFFNTERARYKHLFQSSGSTPRNTQLQTRRLLRFFSRGL